MAESTSGTSSMDDILASIRRIISLEGKSKEAKGENSGNGNNNNGIASSNGQLAAQPVAGPQISPARQNQMANQAPIPNQAAQHQFAQEQFTQALEKGVPGTPQLNQTGTDPVVRGNLGELHRGPVVPHAASAAPTSAQTHHQSPNLPQTSTGMPPASLLARASMQPAAPASMPAQIASAPQAQTASQVTQPVKNNSAVAGSAENAAIGTNGLSQLSERIRASRQAGQSNGVTGSNAPATALAGAPSAVTEPQAANAPGVTSGATNDSIKLQTGGITTKQNTPAKQDVTAVVTKAEHGNSLLTGSASSVGDRTTARGAKNDAAGSAKLVSNTTEASTGANAPTALVRSVRPDRAQTLPKAEIKRENKDNSGEDPPALSKEFDRFKSALSSDAAPAAKALPQTALSQTVTQDGTGTAVRQLISKTTERSVAASLNRLQKTVGDREMARIEMILRPMLEEWIDNNMAQMVERIVREEIRRIAGAG